jgi:prepilin-type N-terminal cleavage/methylation domain-containing protein
MEFASRTRARRSGEGGFSLIETMVGLALLAILAAGVLPLALIATSTSENTGHLSSRSAEYAQDKLEQLMALSYPDSTSDTRQFPAPELGGSGLTIGGSTNAPVALYADYLDFEGALIPSPTGAPPQGWYYQRLWQVTQFRPNLKQITVVATVRNSMGSSALRPRATLTALKSFPF